VLAALAVLVVRPALPALGDLPRQGFNAG